MNIAIIGFGLIGQQRARDIAQMKRHRLVAVCDVNFDLAMTAGEKYGCRTESDWKKIVGMPDIDVVIVAVPHYFSAKITVAALKAGKHVLCEKPLGRNLKEGNTVKEAVKKTGRCFGSGFNFRFYPGIQKVRQLIAGKKIGKITHVRWVFGHGGRRGMEREWKTSKKMCGGGALLDPGIHVIDLSRHLFGEIKEGIFWRKNSFWKIGVEDNAFLLLKTNDGKIISSHFSITEWRNLFRLEVLGTNGYIFLRGRSKSYGPQEVVMGKRWFFERNEKEKIWSFSVRDNSFAKELECFLRQIEAKKASKGFLSATVDDGIRSLEIIEKLYKSKKLSVKL